MQEKTSINIFTDGGSRGNPGPSAYGFSITDDTGKEIAGVGKTIGINTNNVAEYSAVVAAFQWVIDHRSEFGKELKINAFMDSRLVVMQALGKFRVKNPNLQILLRSVREKESELECEITYSHIPREKNKEADRYVNLALDGKI